jgi:hypothetical protein
MTRPDGSAPDDDMTDAEMTPSAVPDQEVGGGDPVGGDDPGDAAGSGVTPESGAWADQSPDGYGGALQDGTGHVAGEDR